MNELVVLVPVLRRPYRVKPVLESLRANTSPCRVLFIADSDDEEEIQALKDEGADYIALEPPVTWPQKINAGYRSTSEPFLFLAADDLKFHKGWYPKAMAQMTDGIGVVGTNDLANPRVIRGEHSTHMLIRRSYIEEFSGVMDEPNTVVHEGYFSDFADDELVQTAMKRSAYAHAHEAIVEHLHPIVGDRPGKLPDDDTYRLARNQFHNNRATFMSRIRLWT